MTIENKIRKYIKSGHAFCNLILNNKTSQSADRIFRAMRSKNQIDVDYFKAFSDGRVFNIFAKPGSFKAIKYDGYWFVCDNLEQWYSKGFKTKSEAIGSVVKVRVS